VHEWRSGAAAIDRSSVGSPRTYQERVVSPVSASGADVSAAVLCKAEEIERREPLGIRYLHADVAEPGLLQGDDFDAVVCTFGSLPEPSPDRSSPRSDLSRFPVFLVVRCVNGPSDEC
jgi:hypothetical protein